ncbi:uncharacterized protein LOC101853626 [Aplysia californica]|uniref:Uncharacterized protein LOC101853626 n=1 Tax=Aplysia californica TaxID=6500 RepID=A0ABM0JTD3_APLCA|nr:uncharacterized protein LOC101853626 [Aplysia californica]
MESQETDTDSLVQMDAVEDADENELLGGVGEEEQQEEGGSNDVDETAEDLMTDMKLEDEIDEARNIEPDFKWTYFIEVYPWSAEDMTENFVKVIKLSHFTRVVMKKKKVPTESPDLQTRQRKGCVQIFLADRQTAKTVMRSMTWKSMAAKELTVEVTRRDPDLGVTESAYLEVNSYSLCKIRFREKAKGELRDRSAKVSNLPGAITLGFLEVILNRAFPVIMGQTRKVSETNPSQKLQDIEGFHGSLDFDCLTRGSCRAFVLAHKKVVMNGQQLGFEANDKETMVVPPFTHDGGTKRKQEHVSASSNAVQPSSPFPSARGRGGHGMGRGGRGGATAFSGPRMRGLTKDGGGSGQRARGLGRAIMPLMRPVSAPFPRVGPGMPVPMTGRQKMNEKLRRNNNSGLNSVPGGGGVMYPVPGGSMAIRGSGPGGSVGDSFKQEIASLQDQLERSTKVIEAKIALLQQSGGFYDAEMAAFGPGFDSGPWDGGDFGYDNDYGVETFGEEDMYRLPAAHDFPAEPHALMQAGVPGRGGLVGVQGYRGLPGRGHRGRGMLQMRGKTRSRPSRRGSMSAAW